MVGVLWVGVVVEVRGPVVVDPGDAHSGGTFPDVDALVKAEPDAHRAAADAFFKPKGP